MNISTMLSKVKVTKKVMNLCVTSLACVRMLRVNVVLFVV